MPIATSRTSASTASQRLAIALTNEIFVARNAFDAYLIISADAGSVDQDRRVEALVEVGDAHGDLRVVAADDDPVRMEEVAHRRALAEELGVRRDADRLERRTGLPEDALHQAG